MYIVPISSSIQPLESVSSKLDTTQLITEDSPKFSDVFKEILQDVKDTQQQLNIDSARLVMGEIDDLHTIYNNMTKAEVAIETFIAIKDAAQQSYKEILQISM